MAPRSDPAWRPGSGAAAVGGRHLSAEGSGRQPRRRGRAPDTPGWRPLPLRERLARLWRRSGTPSLYPRLLHFFLPLLPFSLFLRLFFLLSLLPYFPILFFPHLFDAFLLCRGPLGWLLGSLFFFCALVFLVRALSLLSLPLFPHPPQSPNPWV